MPLHLGGGSGNGDVVKAATDAGARRALLRAVQASAAVKVAKGPDAARSQDFLYDDDGLPE